MTQQPLPLGGALGGFPIDLDAPRNGDLSRADFQNAVERALLYLAARGGRFVVPGNALPSALLPSAEHIFLFRPRPAYCSRIVCRFYYSTENPFDLVDATFEQLAPASVITTALDSMGATFADDIPGAQRAEMELEFGDGSSGAYDDQLQVFRLRLTALNDTTSINPGVRLMSSQLIINPPGSIVEVTL